MGASFCHLKPCLDLIPVKLGVCFGSLVHRDPGQSCESLSEAIIALYTTGVLTEGYILHFLETLSTLTVEHWP